MWQNQVEQLLTTRSGLTQQRYQAALEQFRGWYEGSYGEEPDPTLLTEEEVRNYISYLQTVRGLKATSIGVHLAAVREVCRMAGNTLRVRGPRSQKPPVEALDARELGRLLRTLDGDGWQDRRNVAAASLMARAGLRVGEVVRLNVGELELSKRSGWVLVRGKGNKERRVPLSAEARRAIQSYLEVRPETAGNPALFINRAGARLTARSLQRLITEAARRAGIAKTVTPHTLRHTFATRFLQQGGDLATLSALLGHRWVSTTTRYLHPNAAQIQAMVEEL